MSLVFIFCLFRQCWLLQTHPGQIILYAHAHRAAIHTQVCLRVQVAHVRALCAKARFDKCLPSQKGNEMCLCRDVGLVSCMIRRDVTQSVYVCEFVCFWVCVCVKGQIWSGSD